MRVVTSALSPFHSLSARELCVTVPRWEALPGPVCHSGSSAGVWGGVCGVECVEWPLL